MNLHDIIKESETFSRIKELFPAMVETSKHVEVIPWKEEYAIADRNPEVIEAIEFYRELLKQGIISNEDYEKYVSKFKGYASRTMGIAFTDRLEVSFRETPTIYIAIHELGHCHFKEPDPIWSSTYGGGESLMWLGLNGEYYITEEEVSLYHSMLHSVDIRPTDLAEEIAGKIVSYYNLECPPHLYAISNLAGVVLPNAVDQGMPFIGSFDDPRLLELQVTKQDLNSFLINLIEGLKWKDSFFMKYALALNLVRECPTCKNIPCTCKK